eukprot:Tamp_14287.p1 GENE.Tamp_14287~~Tamp_14287.p1  ORF type:complete len:326 (-),score=94.70 Tamp_14287:625-1602(-)
MAASRRRAGWQTRLLLAVGLLLVAGAPWHVCGNAADRDTSDELPVVGRDAGVASQYDAKKHTLNAPGDEQIPDPPAPNDEEALLKEALSDEAPVESMEDDPEFHEKYQPTYEYEGDDDEADAEGQDESDGLQAVLQAEKAYFIARDHDGDGELSKDEFIRQLNEVDTDEEDSMWDTWNASARGRPAPSREELMFGKDWTARVSAEQAEEAFIEYDVDKDGKVSWAEWQGVMFHEDEQVPEYRDGIEAVVDPLGDDDIDPEELEMIKTRFVEADTDADGLLTLEELHTLIVFSHDQPLYPDGAAVCCVPLLCVLLVFAFASVSLAV